MSIIIKEVKNWLDRTIFIRLPAKIHKNHKNWVPPIYMDDRQFFNPKKNELFAHSDTVLYLARKNNKPVGRIMGVINHEYNKIHNTKEGRFSFIETYNDQEVVHCLIKAIENWARQKGMENVVGPLAFSDKDPQGLLIEGFDNPIVIATNCNFPYMVDLVEKAGYIKKVDLVDYKLEIPSGIPEFYQKIYERASRNNKGSRIIDFSSRRQLKPYIRPVLMLVNETYKNIYGFTPLTTKEMDEFANRYLMILDPRFIKIVETDKKEVIAFIISMPDIGEGIKKCKGRLLPFGIIQLFRAQRKTEQLDLLLGAIKPEYQNSGIDVMMGISLMEEAKKAGKNVIDSHLVLETNTKMRAEMEKMGGVIYKRYRIFQKQL
jgi:hypothetical protein